MSDQYTPGPWEVGRDRDTWAILVLPMSDPLAICIISQYGQPAAANARLIAAAPALALAWSLVPDEIKGRIFDALHKPGTDWVEGAITRIEG